MSSAAQLEGTAPYMSPGVAAGIAEDTRCDIYSFGALLYEMLTGEPPYAGRSTSDIRKQILDSPPKPILERNPAADAGLVAVAEGAMARELRDRYADMADVVADLERIKAGKSVVGPRGLAGRAKRNSFSMWIPVGIGLIAVGLWLLWPPAEEKKTAWRAGGHEHRPHRHGHGKNDHTRRPWPCHHAAAKPVPTVEQGKGSAAVLFAGRPGDPRQRQWGRGRGPVSLARWNYS